MNLLLLDDEEYVIRSIKENVNWEKKGIDGVYTALSINQAKNLMELVPIDIIISDIVMPQGTGFDFIQWVRDGGYEVQVIFLTSYAEFDYAKRAISLESVEYLLKPVDYIKLEEAVGRAVSNVKKNQEYQDYREVKRKWHQNYSVLQKNFWAELLSRQISKSEFQNEVTKRNLSYISQDQFLIIQIVFFNGKKDSGIWEQKTINFIIQNVLSEMLENSYMQIETILSMKEDSSTVICKKVLTHAEDFAVIEEFIQWFSQKLHIDLWCGVGNWEEASAIPDSLAAVWGMYENSSSYRNRAFYLSDFEQPDTRYVNPNIHVWKTLLNQRKQRELCSDIARYLGELQFQDLITRQILKSFRTDLTQLVYSWLAEKEIQAHLLFLSKENDLLFQNALNGVKEMQEYAEYLLEKAIQHELFIDKTVSVVEQIKDYIDEHYKEDIRREDLSKRVYLNTDYISRIFKKEVGISISSYVMKKRVEEAKKMLAQSNFPINTVSIYVGYSNFSYFTKMFKENTGYSPLEYRRMIKKREET